MSLINNLDRNQVVALARLAKQAKLNPAILDDDRVKVDYPKSFEISWEDFCDLAEMVLFSCLYCRLEEKDARTCNIRRIFLQYDLDVLDQENKVCPYQYLKGKEEK